MSLRAKRNEPKRRHKFGGSGLCVGRLWGQEVVIDVAGTRIVVEPWPKGADGVRLKFSAPANVRILRAELVEDDGLAADALPIGGLLVDRQDAQPTPEPLTAA